MRLPKPRRSSWLIGLAAALAGIVGLASQVSGRIDRAVEPVRFGLHEHQASGKTVVVEMDAESAATIKRWPWPRRHYAAVIDQLRAAGAASIVFDVDLSSASDPRDDAILAAALARSQGLVALPTFSQRAGAHDRRQLDALPLPAFREHVALASVSVSPDIDGLVRAMPLATMTAGVPRPSLSAYIAARQGSVDTAFPVNFAIDPASIPRLSFVGVRDGRFDRAAVRGRNILIGATAVEMGDRYATSYRGVLPGVVIQALASETLIAGIDDANAEGTVVVVQINNLDALSAVLGTEGVGHAVVRTAERLRLLSLAATVYRVRSHHLALTLGLEQPVDDAVAALRVMLLEPVEVGGRKVDIAVTVGTAEAGGKKAERLTDAAIAADAAAQEGEFWHGAALDRGALERSVSLMGELDAAIAVGEIGVHYQPKLRLADNRIASTEALVRWNHPLRGFIPPDVFIPMAEHTDRIAPLTLHVLTTVLADVARWRELGHEVTAAVNISAKLLSSASFNAAVNELLLASPVPPEALIFEVTESATMSDPTAAIAALQKYRDQGIAVSMDDYGTGQSTLTYLKRLPLNELKIDRSFVQYAHERSSGALLVRSTIELAHELGLKVVAEGIETEASLDFLRTHGCDYGQGYFISRPVPFSVLLQCFERNDGDRLRATG